MGQHAQPMQQSYRMQVLGTFDDEPAIITCTQCGVTGQTFTYRVSQQKQTSVCTGCAACETAYTLCIALTTHLA